jgi:hypothetical protein
MRMNKTALIALLISLFCIGNALAISAVYESTSVSRIVGNSPAELKNQLLLNSLNLQDAAYSGGGNTPPARASRDILQDRYDTRLTTNPTDFWVQNTDGKLVVIDAYPYGGTPTSGGGFDTSDVSGWQTALKQDPSLVVMNSEFAGLALPKTESFANALAATTPFTGPTAYASQQFVKTLACNLKNGRNLGEAFRQARNNYHWNLKDSNELIGLTLLSYTLYGNALAQLAIPAGGWQEDLICKDITEPFASQAAESYSVSAAGDGEYTKTVTFTIPEHAIEQEGEHELVSTPTTDTQLIPGELAVPVRTLATEFPRETIIADVEFAGFSDPADITADIPSYDGINLTTRSCDYTQDAGVEFGSATTETSKVVLARIEPLQMTSCDDGNFTLYRRAAYEISYYPFSPVRITAVETSPAGVPGTVQPVTVHVENTQAAPVTGLLAITDETGTIITANEISTTQSAHALELPLPETEGAHAFKAEFFQDGESKTYYPFTVDVRVLDAALELPETAEDSATATVRVTSHWQTAIEATITADLSKDGKSLALQTAAITLQPGENAAQFTFEGLEKEDVAYDIAASITYLGTTTVRTGTIVVNHAPVILNANVDAYEGQPLTITPLVQDLDGDSVSADIDATIPVDGSAALTYEQSGTYPVKITATDGIAEVEETVYVTVHNTNRAPGIVAPETVGGREGDELQVSVTTTDPDNQNSVSNDNNELTVTYGAPLDEDGTFTPDYDVTEPILTSVTVSDGEFSETKLVTLNIQNTNRPPHIEVPDQLTASREINLAPHVTVSDPDNENIATNDDNTLTVLYEPPFDANGRWAPPQPGIVFTAVKVSDGEFTVSKSVQIAVDTVNPFPAPITGETPVDITPPANVQPPAGSAPGTTPPPATTHSAQQTPATLPELDIEIKAKAGGRSKKLTGTDTLKVEPEDELELDIDITNNAAVAKKIGIDIDIDDLDEEESDSFTLKPDDKEELEYDFGIPRLTDEEKYRATIVIKDGITKHAWKLDLKVDKPSHELNLRWTRAEQCDGQGTLVVRLENAGSNEEEGTLRLESASLGLDRYIPFALDEGEYKVFREPFFAQEGTHSIDVTARYDNRAIGQTVPVLDC